jgi:FixJ family two-component response regulator
MAMPVIKKLMSQIFLRCTSIGSVVLFWISKSLIYAPPLIAIVDDDALARDGIGELVASLGYETITFSSAQDFLASSVITKTTCLITDLQMPGQNGIELQEALRRKGYCTPVILVTAYPNEQQRKRALDNGAVGFLSKPFDEGSLIRCINAAIKRSASAEKVQ